MMRETDEGCCDTSEEVAFLQSVFDFIDTDGDGEFNLARLVMMMTPMTSTVRRFAAQTDCGGVDLENLKQGSSTSTRWSRSWSTWASRKSVPDLILKRGTLLDDESFILEKLCTKSFSKSCAT